MEFDGGLISPQNIVTVELNPTIVSKSRNMVNSIYQMGLRHKWKTGLIIALCYASFKAFNFYSTLKMMFGGPALSDNELKMVDEKQQSVSIKSLEKLLLKQGKEQFEMCLNMFKSSQLRIKDNIEDQVRYICGGRCQSNSEQIDLWKSVRNAHESTQTAQFKSFTSLQKCEIYEHLKVEIFKAIFSQIYGTRILNLICKVQFSQIGKLFYQFEIKHLNVQKKRYAEEANNRPKDEPIPQGPSEADRKAVEEREQFQVKLRESSQQFIEKVCDKIVMPFIQNDLIPFIAQICENKLSRPVNKETLASKDQEGLGIKDKIKYTEYQKIIRSINSQIQEKLFGSPNSNEDQIEPQDEEEDTNCSYWLSYKLSQKFEQSRENFKTETGLLEEMCFELLDFAETDYYQGALFELLQSSYEYIFEDFLHGELKKDSNNFFKYGKDAIAVIHVVKLVTCLTKLYKTEVNLGVIDQSNQATKIGTITHQLSKHISRSMNFQPEEQKSNMNPNIQQDAMLQEFPALMPDQQIHEALEEKKQENEILDANQKEYKEQLSQLVKIVFFDKEAPHEAKMEDLMGDVSKIVEKQAPGGDDGDMMNELMSMMGNMEGEGGQGGEGGAEMAQMMKMLSGGLK